MKNLRKVFAMMLALCMVIGTMTITAFADLGDYEEPYELYAGNVRPIGVYVEPAATMYIKADNYNGTVVSAMAYDSDDLETPMSNYMLGYGRQTVPANTDGTCTLELVQMGGDMFSVYNTGEKAITVYLTLAAGAAGDSTGTMDDPEEIVLESSFFGISGTKEHEFEAGDEPYYYFVTAPADGKLSIGIRGTYDADFNPVEWQYCVNSMGAKADGTYYYGYTHWSDDEEVVMMEELEVKAGEKYIMWVNTYNTDIMQSTPAGTITVTASFDPVGSWGNPDTATTGTKEYTFEAGSTGYYVNWTADKDGDVIISVSSDEGWTYVVNNEDAGKYGDTHWYDDDPVVSSETWTVAEGDVLTIMINTYDAETYESVDGKVTLTIEYDEEEPSTEEETTTSADGSGAGETTTSATGGATPNTGDGSMVGILLALAAVSAIVVLKKKTVVE